MTVIPVTTATPVASHPYRALGGFRFLLALLVLVSHSSIFLPGPLFRLGLGNVGVMSFFVVSGFVIAEALDLFYRRSARRFLANRGLKIFPAYWAALPLGYVVLLYTGTDAASTSPIGIAVNVSLLGAYLPAWGGLLVISAAWAVIVEFQFYFAAAAVSSAGRYLRSLPGCVAASLALALIGYGFVVLTHGHARFYGALGFAPFFVLGVALYLRLAHPQPVLLPLTIIAALTSIHAYFDYNDRSAEAWPIWSTVIFLVVMALFVVLGSARLDRSAERLDRHLGDLTYAVYLVHMPFVALARFWSLNGAAALGFVLVASFATATVIQVAVERPVIRLRNKLRGRSLHD